MNEWKEIEDATVNDIQIGDRATFWKPLELGYQNVASGIVQGVRHVTTLFFGTVTDAISFNSEINDPDIKLGSEDLWVDLQGYRLYKLERKEGMRK